MTPSVALDDNEPGTAVAEEILVRLERRHDDDCPRLCVLDATCETLPHRAFDDDRDARSRVFMPSEPLAGRELDVADREPARPELTTA